MEKKEELKEQLMEKEELKEQLREKEEQLKEQLREKEEYVRKIKEISKKFLDEFQTGKNQGEDLENLDIKELEIKTPAEKIIESFILKIINLQITDKEFVKTSIIDFEIQD